MKKDLYLPMLNKSSFWSCEKDTEKIIRKLFVESRPHSDELKRLLVINTNDCLDSTSDVYNKIIQETSIETLVKKGYIRISPKVSLQEHDEVKSYIIISYDNFIPNENNPEFYDCTISFDVICNTDYWELGNFKVRPLKICGYIDGILNKTRLSGIGELNFLGCSQLVLSDELSGYTLMYRAVHGSDDKIPPKDIP